MTSTSDNKAYGTDKIHPDNHITVNDDDTDTSEKNVDQVANDTSDTSSESLKEVFDVKQYDPVLAKKMAIVNQAIDDIGMTGFQWKLFFLNGFGYAVDSVSYDPYLFPQMLISISFSLSARRLPTLLYSKNLVVRVRELLEFP
jgi:hypothetical protein